MKEITVSRPVLTAAVFLMIIGTLLIAGCSSNAPSGSTAPAGPGSPLATAPPGQGEPVTTATPAQGQPATTAPPGQGPPVTTATPAQGQPVKTAAATTKVTTVTVTYTIPPEPSVTLERPSAGSVKAVSNTQLIPFLPPAPSGWTASDPEGSDISDPATSWSMASRSYSGGAGQVADVTIIDSAYYYVGPWTGWAALTDETTSNGYTKAGTTAGFPSWESYDKSSSSYDTWVGINKRFLVTVSITGGSRADLDSFVGSINYAGIAALK